MKKIYLVRIDDVCPTMNYEKFMERIHFFEGFGIKPLLGVIPDCKDEELKFGKTEDFWGMIRGFSDAGYPIAMHGYNHVYITKNKGLVCNRKLSEFSGLSFDEQLSMLKKGKAILEENGVHTDWFMAPGHSYDYQTVKALYESGFRYVTDGRSSLPYVMHGVTFIPASSIWESPFNGEFVTICLHPNTDSERKYQKVKDFIERNRSYISSFSEVEQWRKRKYCFCRIDEILRMYAEKTALFLYNAIKLKVYRK